VCVCVCVCVYVHTCTHRKISILLLTKAIIQFYFFLLISNNYV